MSLILAPNPITKNPTLIFEPLLWLASSGSRSLNKTRTAALINRQVLILSDADDAGRKGAQRTLHLLKQLGIEAQIKDLFPDKADHTDLADYLINHLRHKYSVLVHEVLPIQKLPLAHPLPEDKLNKVSLMFDKYPILWQLNEQLGLEIIG